jgi:pre-rRNA-processing protein IPI1
LNSSTYTDAEYVEEFSLAFESNGNAELGLDTLEIPFASTSTSAPEVSSSISHSSTLPTSLLSLLHPTLLSSFLDSAPSAFSPTPDSNSDSHLTTIAAVIAVSRELFWAELGGVGETVAVEREKEKEKEKERARKLLVTMLNHVAVYFPFGGDELEERSKEVISFTFTFLY